MCEYCGCQEVPAIAQLTVEHDEIRAVAREAGRAGHSEDHGAAVAAAQRLLELLEPHTAIEERGLFPAMAGEFAEHTSSLVADHRRIEDALADLASSTGPSEGWTGGWTRPCPSCSSTSCASRTVCSPPRSRC